VFQISAAFRQLCEQSVALPMTKTQLGNLDAVSEASGEFEADVKILPILWIDDLHCCDPVFAADLVQAFIEHFRYPVLFTVSERDGYEKLLSCTSMLCFCVVRWLM
jgi:IS4 transposase